MGTDLFEFARAQAWIHRNRPGIELADREQHRTECNAVFARDHHAVAWPDLQLAQIACHRLGRVGKLPVAPDTSGFDERRMIRRLPCKPGIDGVHAGRQTCNQTLRSDLLGNRFHRTLPRR
jgi:hypothetical protein